MQEQTFQKKIYLACPYSHKDHQIEKNRAKAASLKAAELLNKGYLVFSPISHGHAIAQQGQLPGDFDFWRSLDESFIQWADIVSVLTLPGWRKSVGVQQEIKLAKKLGKTINYVLPYNKFGIPKIKKVA